MCTKFCEILFACLKYMRCIEIQTNNMGFEKYMWDITRIHTHTHRHTHTHADKHIHKDTHTDNIESLNTLFISLESCLKIWGRQRPTACLPVVIFTNILI
jgi:hypothetical protein